MAVHARMGERGQMPTNLSVVVGNVTLAVRAWTAEEPSNCPPVVLLPATGESAEDWDVVAAALKFVTDRVRRQSTGPWCQRLAGNLRDPADGRRHNATIGRGS